MRNERTKELATVQDPGRYVGVTRPWIEAPKVQTAPAGDAADPSMPAAIQQIDELAATCVMVTRRKGPKPAGEVVLPLSADSFKPPSVTGDAHGSTLPRKLPTAQELFSLEGGREQHTQLDALGMHRKQAAARKAAASASAGSVLETVMMSVGSANSTSTCTITRDAIDVPGAVRFSPPMLGAASAHTAAEQIHARVDEAAVEVRARAAEPVSRLERQLETSIDVPLPQKRTSSKRLIGLVAACLVAVGSLWGSEMLKERMDGLSGSAQAQAKAEDARALTRRAAMPAAGGKAQVAGPTTQGPERESSQAQAMAPQEAALEGAAHPVAPNVVPEAVPKAQTLASQSPTASDAPHITPEPAPQKQAAVSQRATASDAPHITPEPALKDSLSADPTVAADLLVNGRVREALSEYRVLSTLHPDQPVYREIASVLRRRLINTCKRAQPHRQQECEQL